MDCLPTKNCAMFRNMSSMVSISLMLARAEAEAEAEGMGDTGEVGEMERYSSSFLMENSKHLLLFGRLLPQKTV